MPLYLGQPARHWGEQLASRDATNRAVALLALRELGEAGYSHLLRDVDNPAPAARLTALEAIAKPLLLAHKQETYSLLLRLLKDDHWQLRQAAVLRLSWFEAEGKVALPQLEQLAEHDPNPDVQEAAKISIAWIEHFAFGKPSPLARKQ